LKVGENVTALDLDPGTALPEFKDHSVHHAAETGGDPDSDDASLAPLSLACRFNRVACLHD